MKDRGRPHNILDIFAHHDDMSMCDARMKKINKKGTGLPLKII